MEKDNFGKIVIIIGILFIVLIGIFAMKVITKEEKQQLHQDALNYASDANERFENKYSHKAENVNISNPYEISDYMQDVGESELEHFAESDLVADGFSFLGKYFAIAVILMISNYICMAIGLSNIARENGYSNWIMAWIPFLNLYLLYKVAFNDSKLKWLFLLVLLTGEMSIGGMSVGFNEIFQVVIQLGLIIFMFIAFYNIFKEKTDKSMYMLIAMVLFSIIGYKFGGITLGGIYTLNGIIGSYLLFAVRNK